MEALDTLMRIKRKRVLDLIPGMALAFWLTFSHHGFSTPPESRSEPVGLTWHFEDDSGWIGYWEREGTKESIGSFVLFSGVFRKANEENLESKLMVRIASDGTVIVLRYDGREVASVADCEYEGAITGPLLGALDGKASYLDYTEIVGTYACVDERNGIWTASFR